MKLMKYISALFFLMFIGVSVAQNSHTSTVNGHVIVFENLPNSIGGGKANRLSQVLNAYLESIVKSNYNQWYSQLSDSTKSRVIPVKFPKKFERLKSYNIETLDTIYIEKIILSNKLKTNETGDLYDVYIRFSSPLVTENRVSFDLLKGKSFNENDRFKMGINIALTNSKVFHVFLHKYQSSDKKNK